MKWKVQEYEKVIPQDIYISEMRQIINDSDDWKVIDYTERKQAIENMYLHIIERLESAIDNFQTHERLSMVILIKLFYIIIRYRST